MEKALLARVLDRAQNPLHRFDEDDPGRPLPEPLDTKHLSASENALGFAVPSLLLDLFGHVANGGFGPGYGFFGLDGGWAVGDRNAVECYFDLRAISADDPNWRWPESALPIVDWGCGMCSYIDCLDAELAVTWFDPNPYDPGAPWEWCCTPHGYGLAELVQRWADGVDLFDELIRRKLD